MTEGTAVTDDRLTRPRFLARVAAGMLLPFAVWLPLSVLLAWFFGWTNGPPLWPDAPAWVEPSAVTAHSVLPPLLGFGCLPLPNRLHLRFVLATAYAVGWAVLHHSCLLGLWQIGFFERVFA